MKEIKLMLSVFMFALAMLTAIGASQESWDLGSSEDWLSTGPVYHIGPFYYPNSDLPIGTQRFLDSYSSYMPLGYSNYYQTYNPQAALDLAIANHAYQKSLPNYYSRHYGTYPWYYGTYPY
jgi:hypothetical protein